MFWIFTWQKPALSGSNKSQWNTMCLKFKHIQSHYIWIGGCVFTHVCFSFLICLFAGLHRKVWNDLSQPWWRNGAEISQLNPQIQLQRQPQKFYISFSRTLQRRAFFYHIELYSVDVDINVIWCREPECDCCAWTCLVLAEVWDLLIDLTQHL